MSTEQNDQELHAKILQLVRATMEHDVELRKKYEIENKFRFVSERLQVICGQLEQALHISPTAVAQENNKDAQLLDDEVVVYVYLYNAHGVVLASWQNMLTPKVFYEYSVNRPIYTEKSYLQALLRTKSNKAQHAYLAVAIKAAHIIQSEAGLKDGLGNPMIKIKEGSLFFEKLLSFTYNDHEYILRNGELIKKS